MNVDLLPVAPPLLKHLLEDGRSGGQDALVGRNLFSMDVEGNVLALLILEQPSQELSICFPPHGHRSQHLVIKKQLSDGVSESSIHTSLSIECI